MVKVIYRFYFFIILVFLVIISCKTVNNTSSTGRLEAERMVKQESSVPIFIEEIPILAWYGVAETTIERYQELKDAGINSNFSYHANLKDLTLAMDVAKAAGIKMIIHCPELETEPEKIVNLFKDHPALAGYHIKDEPNRNEFTHWGELVRKIQALDNKHFCYINIFPNYVSSEQIGTSTYLEYIQLFLQEVPVPFLSFDFYPILVKSSGVRFLRNNWYENLEIILKETRNAGIPFCAFALTTSHWSFPIPTLADLRLQVFSNLAYGAQGIQYFTYWTPSTDEGADFHEGPIDFITQQKTPTWYIVQQMNKEIKALSNVFLGAQVIQVRHIVKTAFGTNGAVPNGTTRFNFANRPAEANIINTLKIPNRTNAVISFLKNDNRCYMVIINRNLSGGRDVTFTINGDAGLQLINKDGTIVPASSENSKQTVTPGDVLIYGWDTK
jgi:hypothetical protein